MPEEKRKPESSPEQTGMEKPTPSQQERPAQPEKKETESKITQPEKVGESHAPIIPPSVTAPRKEKVAQPEVKSENLKKIETILSQGLEQIYQDLPDNLKQEFKTKGDKTASKIEGLLNQAKVVVYKIVDLIKNWLSMVPGVNKFFLEQETKIKTERILALKNKEKH